LDGRIDHRAAPRRDDLRQDPARRAVPLHQRRAVRTRRAVQDPVDGEGEAHPRLRGDDAAHRHARRGHPVDQGSDRRRTHLNARLALWVFVAVEVYAAARFFAASRHVWFWLDDWDFVAGRSLSIHSLFATKNGHLTALPIVEFRILYKLVGLR